MQVEVAPAEAWVLLKAEDPDAWQAVKITLVSLIADGILHLADVPQHGLFRARPVQAVVTTGRPLASEAPHLDEVLAAVRASELSPDRRDICGLVSNLRGRFGAMFGRYLYELVAPGLAARGLLRLKPRRFLWLEVWPAIALTAAGEEARGRIAGALRHAGEIEALLKRDPALAAAKARTLGPLLHLASELWPHYGELAEAMRHHPGGATGSGAARARPEPLDADLPSGIGAALAAFDASFDAESAGAGVY